VTITGSYRVTFLKIRAHNRRCENLRSDVGYIWVKQC
jgi:hypothetical protein